MTDRKICPGCGGYYDPETDFPCDEQREDFTIGVAEAIRRYDARYQPDPPDDINAGIWAWAIIMVSVFGLAAFLIVLMYWKLFP